MRYTVLTLADAVTVREGLMSILSGGVTSIRPEQFPAPLDVWLALAVEFTPGDLRKPRVVSLRVSIASADGGDPFFEVSGTLVDTSGLRYGGVQPAQLNAPIHLRGALIPAPGLHTIRVAIDGLAEQQLLFEALGPTHAAPLA